MPHDLRVITYETIVAGARRHFLRSGTIDIEDTSAYLYVRLRESILYADVVSGRQPDPDVAERAVRALLTSR